MARKFKVFFVILCKYFIRPKYYRTLYTLLLVTLKDICMFWKHNYITFSCSALLIYMFLLVGQGYTSSVNPTPTYHPQPSHQVSATGWQLATKTFLFSGCPSIRVCVVIY